jgi:8-oxo-dGTP pyrophosphatase MutT (NUDIX family)
MMNGSLDSTAGTAAARRLTAHSTGYLEQAGAICVRQRKGKAEVLLINGKRNGKWGIPKGSIEPGESPSRAAAREAFEEAGVYGQCHEQSLGSFNYLKQGKLLPCRVSVHLMDVQRLVKTFPEVHIRTPRWFNGETAAELVGDEGLKAIFQSMDWAKC